MFKILLGQRWGDFRKKNSGNPVFGIETWKKGKGIRCERRGFFMQNIKNQFFV